MKTYYKVPAWLFWLMFIALAIHFILGVSGLINYGLYLLTV